MLNIKSANKHYPYEYNIQNAVKLDFNHIFVLNPFCHSPFNDIPVWMPGHPFILHLKGASLYPMLKHKLSTDQMTVGQMTEIAF